MHVIAVVSPKGGAGKSTVTANLAVALGQREQKVLVVDFDPQNAQRHHLGLDASEVAGLVREGITPDTVFDSPFGVGFVPYGVANDKELEEFRAELVEAPFWLREHIHALSLMGWDVVLIDTPPGANTYAAQALCAADRALVVVQPDAAAFLSLPGMQRLLEEYATYRDDFVGYHYLLNQMPQKNRLAHQVRQALQAEVADRLIPLAVHRDPAAAHALAHEQALLHFEPGSMASLDFQYLADWLLDAMDR